MYTVTDDLTCHAQSLLIFARRERKNFLRENREDHGGREKSHRVETKEKVGECTTTRSPKMETDRRKVGDGRWERELIRKYRVGNRSLRVPVQ